MMNKSRLLIVAGLALVIWCGWLGAVTAEGPVGPITVEMKPVHPMPNDTIQVTVSGEWPDSCTPQYVSYEVQRTSVRVWTAIPLHQVCLFVFTRFQLSIEINPLPSGVYTLDVVGPIMHSSSFTVSASRIRDIQGAGHQSLLAGQGVENIPGVVTAVRADGFYFQDPAPDGNLATAEGIFVFTREQPTVAVGDSVVISGTVVEFYPGGRETGNLSTTEISTPTVIVLSSGNPLPAAMVIGNGGRIPPQQAIEDDANGDVEVGGVFDPEMDGIDFYESLEAMVVAVEQAVVVGSNGVGEIVVLGDGGANAMTRTVRGGIVVQASDFNPERIVIDDTLVITQPRVTVGDVFSGTITGVLDYTFGNFKLLNTAPLPAIIPGQLVSETTTLSGDADHVTIGVMNLENLDPSDPPRKVQQLAAQIVKHLGAPAIVVVTEVQDNNGAVDDGTVAATQTWLALITAIQGAGGPVYDFREVAPQNNQDGGEPGGNIRQGFLFQPGRVTFVDRPGATATTATTVTIGAGGGALSLSPGRIEPSNSAFADSRKPLVGEFIFQEQRFFVIANHFNSKGSDDPLFGRRQPAVLASAEKRQRQAQVVNDFVDRLLALDPNAGVVVAGDLNDFPFSTPVQTLAGGVLTNLVSNLPLAEQYTYIFDGNAQVLDQILVSGRLAAGAEVDVVHTNAEFSPDVRPSDHDPLVARLAFGPSVHLPTVYLPVIVSPEVNVPGQGAQVVIERIEYDGKVPQVESDEYAVIANVGSAAVNLQRWRLNAGDPGQNFVFPSYALQPGERCQVYTNEIHPETCGFSFGSGAAIWRNTGDCGYLYDAAGVEVDPYCYGNAQPGG